MAQTKTKKQIKISWLLIAILALLLVLPSSIFTKLVALELSPFLLAALRSAIVSIVALPLIISAFRKHRKMILKKLPVIITVSLIACISGPLHTMAIANSGASFIEILNLSAPIVFSVVSILVVKDRLSRYAVAGLLMAILGGVVIILLPLILGNGTIAMFGWLPVAFQGFVIVASAVYTVYLRKVNESGIPLSALIGIGFVITFIVSTILVFMVDGSSVFTQIGDLSLGGWAMVIYMAVVISALARIISVKAYEHIGTATFASLDYLYYFMAIVAPVFILGEIVSWEMAVGAVLISVGIVLTRMHHKKAGGRHYTHLKGHHL